MDIALHVSKEQLEAGLDHVLASPTDAGTVDLILRRPDVDAREVLESVELTLSEGVAGDNWNQRSSSRMPDGSPHPDMQLNIMNSRMVALVAQHRDRWQLAGDQLYVDLDLSEDNLPAGTHLAIGSAVIVITDQPHTGCAKFTQRFGLDAHRFVNSERGRTLGLRGRCARVVTEGTITNADTVIKL